MEEGMRHFYVRAIAAKQTKQPDEVIDAAMIQAVQIAEKIAPYRHARLSAVKLAGDTNAPIRFKTAALIDTAMPVRPPSGPPGHSARTAR
jgi:hypothetical protein